MPFHNLSIKAMSDVSPQPTSHAAFLSGLGDLLIRYSEYRAERARIKKTVQDLENLSDHMLKDIGLTRFDVYHSRLPNESYHY